ncbi:growth hormone secretagogue receptor type 1-like [Portunus trituberculatus]|uniref:growth hormone secretagogue receptor type 1-like n=1 Tax=Portunus trituberculatus TaxID=210409 RepID=UPI001E1CCB26|nr:growth hormone secretagogue receptor type 1-like [Portunus trituberculatus]XP_045123664.1 growth hormone secretagogue receptor type 1-like [Portunus trituberculatus]
MLTTGLPPPLHHPHYSHHHQHHLRHHDHRRRIVHNTFLDDDLTTATTTTTTNHHQLLFLKSNITTTTTATTTAITHASYTPELLYSVTTTAMNVTSSSTPATAASDDYYYGNLTSNLSTASPPVFPEYIKVVSTLFCCLVLVVGVVGNVLVPVVILKDRDMRNSTNYFLMNLSAADLLVLLFCLPPVLVELHSPPQIWVMGYGMCKLTSYVEMSVVHASALSLVVISLERYHVICQPLQAGYRCTKAKAMVAILVIWVVAFLSAGPTLWIVHYGRFQYYDGTLQHECLLALTTSMAISFMVASHVFFFFVPMVVLVLLYAVIARRLLVDTSDLTHKKENPQTRARRQVVVMMATVVFFYFLCLLPIRVFFLWIIAVPQEDQFRLGIDGFYNILYFCRVMFYINSSINPILYNMTSTKFRTAFRRVFRGRGTSSRRYNASYSNTSCNTPTLANNIRLHYGANCSLVYKTVYSKCAANPQYSYASSASTASQVTRQTSYASTRRSRSPTRDTFV